MSSWPGQRCHLFFCCFLRCLLLVDVCVLWDCLFMELREHPWMIIIAAS